MKPSPLRCAPRALPLTIALAITATLSPLPAAPVINEFVAVNHGPEMDDLSRTSDWIEIKNPGPGSVDLAGWSLTDEPDLPRKWVFPSLTLNVGQFLIVRASEMDRRDPTQTLHTNFTLSGSGEFLGLYSPEGVCASCWEPYARQFPGVSFGTVPGGMTYGYFPAPTQGVENTGEVLTDYVRDTHFSVDRGFFTSPFQVVLSTETQGASVRYTTDGSVPDETIGILYSAPLTITTTTVLRARAFKAGMVPSNTDTQTYIFATTWKTQPDFPPGVSASWGQFNASFKVLADYGMNPAVTNDAVYGPLVIPAMTQPLPVVCLTGGAAEIFGDDGLHGDLRNTDTEIGAAIEYFNPNAPDDRFSTRIGLQMHGGAVREHAKKAFRLDFTGTFGDGVLRHPLFAGSPVEWFDQLVLRPGGHDSFTTRVRGGAPDQNDHPVHAGYLRDQFLRRTESEIGLLSPRGRYVHLCINGLYWGVYELHERPNAEFSRAHAGGRPETWDVLHHDNSGAGAPQILEGTDSEWNALQALSAGPVTGDAEYLALAALLGPDQYIDHLLVRMWAGDHDWLGPAYMPSSTQGTTANVAVYSAKNWYALRDSRAAVPGPWQFFTWDGEICMGNHLLFRFFSDLPTPQGLDFPHYRELNMDVTGIAQENTPAAPWAALSAHPEFRLKVADRARKLLFNDGALSPAAATARTAALIQELDLPIVAESARWGGVSGFGFRSVNGALHRVWDNTNNVILTRDTHWRPEVAWLRDTFCAQRGAIFLPQLRARNLYPAVAPVEISPFGGFLEATNVPSLSAPAGTIYFTIDGTDPRVPFTGAVAPGAMVPNGNNLPSGSESPFTIKARAFTTEWSALTEARFTWAGPPTSLSIAVTELHYHPAPPTAAEVTAGFTDADDFEYLEITNVSNGPPDNGATLSNLRFAAGIDFDFAAHSGLSELTPNDPIVIASNAAAFQMRYGVAPDGVFAHGTRLSNSGERIKLVRADGLVIAEFDYNDRGDWPVSADGGGHSLHLLAPHSQTDPDPAENWRADVPSPGALNPPLDYPTWRRDFFTAAEISAGLITGPLTDADSDGTTNFFEYVTKTHPRRTSALPMTATFPIPGKIRYVWELRAEADLYGTALQISSTLGAWQTPSFPPNVDQSPTGRATTEFTYEVDLPAAGRSFIRLHATPPP